MTSCPHLQGVILEYFEAYFGTLRLLFENRSICSVKFCTGVLGVPFEGHCIFFFYIMTFLGSLRGYFWAHFGQYFITVQYFLMKPCTGVLGITLMVTTLKKLQTFLVFLLRVTALFFSISWPSWWAFQGIFGLILGNVYLLLHNCSISSHATLYRCSWYNPDGNYTQHFLHHAFPLLVVIFGVFWDLFLHMYIFFLVTHSIFCHEILHRCSWYSYDYH